jgi:hypothetical protein
MPAVPLQCPFCAGLIQIDTVFAGQQVACPLCQNGMAVPPEPMLLEMLAAAGIPLPAPPPSSPEQPGCEVFTLACPVCAGPFQALASMSGQQVGCPHCGTPVTIPALETPSLERQMAPANVEPDPSLAIRAFAEPIPDERFPPQSQPAERDRRPEPARERPKRERSMLEREAADRLPPQPVARPAIPKDETPNIDDLLPPGLGSAPVESAEPATSEAPAIDDLQPRGAADYEPDAPGRVAPQPSVIDALLPPGATSDEAASIATEQVAIPQAPKRPRPLPSNLPAGAIPVPTLVGGFVAIQEKPKTVGAGDDEFEVRRLTPEEKAKRRFRRNIIMGAFCLAILVVVMLLMMWQ